MAAVRAVTISLETASGVKGPGKAAGRAVVKEKKKPPSRYGCTRRTNSLEDVRLERRKERIEFDFSSGSKSWRRGRKSGKCKGGAVLLGCTESGLRGFDAVEAKREQVEGQWKSRERPRFASEVSLEQNLSIRGEFKVYVGGGELTRRSISRSARVEPRMISEKRNRCPHSKSV